MRVFSSVTLFVISGYNRLESKQVLYKFGTVHNQHNHSHYECEYYTETNIYFLLTIHNLSFLIIIVFLFIMRLIH